MPEEAQAGFEAEGVGIECHSECLTGEVWPLWCFAQKVSDVLIIRRSSRYCSELVPNSGDRRLVHYFCAADNVECFSRCAIKSTVFPYE